MDSIDCLAKFLILHGVPVEVVNLALAENNERYLRKLYDNLPWVDDDIEF